MDNKHHLLARSRCWSDEPENLVVIDEKLHQAIHKVFWIKTPAEQIRQIIENNFSILQGDFIQDIMNVLELYEEDIYHSDIKLWYSRSYKKDKRK